MGPEPLLSLVSCVTVGELLCLLQSPSYTTGRIRTIISWCDGLLNKIMHVKDLSQCLVQSNRLVNVCYHYQVQLSVNLRCDPVKRLVLGS